MVKIPEWWIETTLGEIVEVKSWSTPSTKEESYWDWDISWITPKDLSSYNKRFIDRWEKNITELWLKKSSAQLLPKNTVLFSSRAPIWYVAIANKELTTNQWFKNLVCDEINSHFMFFYYRLKNKKNFIEWLASWSTFSEISWTWMKNLPILLPPLPEQKAIAGVLSSFDDKIELLRAENQTLEEMGQTLFKEWFISPLAPWRGNWTAKNSSDSKKEKSPLGDLGAELPDGWKVGKLGDIIEFIIDNRWKTPLTSDKWDYPMVEINAIIWDGMIINISDCKKFVWEELYNTWFRKWHPKRWDVLFSTVWSIWEIAFVFDEIFCIAQNIVWLRSKYWKFMYLLLKSIQWNLKALDISSVQPSIKLPHLLDYDIVIPDEISIKEFEARVSPIFEKINNNWKQINTLISTRDQLLPKLMSWEVRVEF